MVRLVPRIGLMFLVAVVAIGLMFGEERSTAQGAPGSGDVKRADAGVAKKEDAKAQNAIEFPNSPIGAHARWLVTALTKAGEGLDEQSVLAYHADDFFDGRTAAELVETIRTMSTLIGTGKVKRVFSHRPTAAFVRIEAANGLLYRLALNCQSSPPNRMTMWQLTQDQTPKYEKAPTDFAGLDAALDLLAAETGYVFAEIKDGALVPLRSRNSKRRGNVASVHKLYTLGELCRQIEAGSAKWDETMLLQDSLKVGGSGDLRDAKAGTSLTLREYAKKMISISDNTATDHLLNLLGREKIEAMVGTMGHSEPSATMPFLAIREAFSLMGTVRADIVQLYRAADTAGRREILATSMDELGPLSFGNRPRNIDVAGWFASPEDMARAMLYLHGKMSVAGLGPLGDVMSAPDAYPRGGWAEMYFKGGSTNGVLAGAWLLKSKDGRWFTWTVVANDATKILDEMLGIELFLESVGIANSTIESAKGEGGKQ